MTTTATKSSVEDVTVEVWGDRITVHVKMAGSGPPLVYLHDVSGPHWDAQLSSLAEQYTVYAPEFPGTSAGDPYSIHAVDELSDLVLVYEEVLRGLGVTGATLVGESFGGMLAAELAAHFPTLVSQLVLLDPLGLWRDDEPVTNWLTAPADQVPGLLFHDPAGDGARAAAALPEDPDAARAAMVSRVWATGCCAKFIWPLPDRGLRRRLHRITARTLLVWGRGDRIVPVKYADEFASSIPDATVAVIEDCGHLPWLEQPGRTMSVITDFLR